jgi:hypothetical protein
MAHKMLNRSTAATRKMMQQIKQPSKEQVRHYLQQRQAEHKSPPTLEEIRRQLGWQLCSGVSSQHNSNR